MEKVSNWQALQGDQSDTKRDAPQSWLLKKKTSQMISDVCMTVDGVPIIAVVYDKHLPYSLYRKPLVGNGQW